MEDKRINVDMYYPMTSDLEFRSCNDEIIVDYTDYVGPTLILEDNTALIFNTMDGYSDCTFNTNIISTDDGFYVDIDELFEFIEAEDDVTGYYFYNREIINAQYFVYETDNGELVKIIRLFFVD